MKLKNSFRLVVLISAFSLALLLFSSYPLKKSISASEDTIIFSVVSDVHIKEHSTAEDDKFKNALEYLNAHYPKLDAFIAAGDITNSGSDLEYNKFNEVYTNYANKSCKKIISMGNHDYWNKLSTNDAQTRFEEKTGNTPNSHTKVQGYHFISISSEDGECHGTFSETSKTWLKSELDMAVSESPSKPTFIIVHQPIKDTIYGSDEWGNDSLQDILKNYPQSIVFTGHSHYPLNDQRSINQKDFTSVGTSSLSYVELESGKINGSIPPNAGAFSQGLVVEVSSSEVKITPIDFYNKKFISDPWIIKTPINKKDFNYTTNRGCNSPRPYFNNNDSVTAKELSYDAATINFNTGNHFRFVHSYRIQIWNLESNKIEQDVYAFSDFYLNTHSDYQNVRIDKLLPNTKYKVYIRAIDSFGKTSLNSLSTEFTTKIS